MTVTQRVSLRNGSLKKLWKSVYIHRSYAKK